MAADPLEQTRMAHERVEAEEGDTIVSILDDLDRFRIEHLSLEIGQSPKSRVEQGNGGGKMEQGSRASSASVGTPKSRSSRMVANWKRMLGEKTFRFRRTAARRLDIMISPSMWLRGPRW